MNRTNELRLRVTVEHPPERVLIKMQRGRDELLSPTGRGPDSLRFDLIIRLGASRSPGQIRFLGEFAQGPAGARFLYVNSGVRAGQTGTLWERRAKISLTGISAAQIRKV